MSSSPPKRSRRGAPLRVASNESQSQSGDHDSQEMLYFRSQTHADSYALQKGLEKLQNRATRSRDRQIKAVQERLVALEVPVYKLSDELLAHIFALGAEEEEDTSFAELVSHVVSRWRRVAFASPTLWTSINVKARRGPKSSTALERLTCLVDRASTQPLRLTIEVMSLVPHDSVLAMQITEFVFGPLLARCTSLDCRCPFLPLDISVTAESSILKRLVLRTLSDTIDLSLLSRLPALAELSLQLIGFLPSLLSSRPNHPMIFPSLRKLSMSFDHEMESSLHLACFPQLETLEILDSDVDIVMPWLESVSSTSGTNHQLPCLRVVQITRCSRVPIQTFTQFLCSLPSLRELFLTGQLVFISDRSQDPIRRSASLWSPALVNVTIDVGVRGNSFTPFWLQYLHHLDRTLKLGVVRVRQPLPLVEAQVSLLGRTANKWELLPWDPSDVTQGE